MTKGPLLVCLLSAALVSPVRAQVVEVMEGPFVPYSQNGITPAHGPDPTPFVRVYTNVLTSDAGQLLEMPGAGSISMDAARHSYSALDFVFSVTSLMLMTEKDESQRGELNALGELKRATAHVRAEALASDKKTVLATTRQDPALLTLVTTPSDIQYGEPPAQSPLLSTAVSVVAPYLKVAGPMIQTFMSGRQQKPSLAFFAYQSADDEFGWNWYASPNATVEGTHRVAALMQVRRETAYITLTIDLVTDWQRFGVWTKSYTFLVALPPAPKTPAGATK